MTSESDYQQAYLRYCLCLYELEKEGWNFGDWPTYEQFKVIFDEEVASTN